MSEFYCKNYQESKSQIGKKLKNIGTEKFVLLL